MWLLSISHNTEKRLEGEFAEISAALETQGFKPTPVEITGVCPALTPGTAVLPEASCLLTPLAFLLEQKLTVQSAKPHQKSGWDEGQVGLCSHSDTDRLKIFD